MEGHGAPGVKGAKEGEEPDCYWLTVDRSLQLIQKMGGFLGAIAALTGTVCLVLLAAWQLRLAFGQVTPNPATAPWRHSNHQPGTSVRLVTETAVMTVTSPSDPSHCLTGALHGQVLDCHSILLRDTRSQLQALERRVDRLERRLGDRYPQVKFRSYRTRKRILVTGGAGFVGSHLVDRLLLDGHEVIVVDNLQTGRRRNLETWLGHTNFQFVTHDVVMPFFAEVDEIYHLASPASPPHYTANPVKTIKTNTLGTLNMLGLAKRVGARLLLASTSEVYGDPEVHPQPETYWGNVNPIGPRACYDEGKRVSETLAFAYQERSNVSIAIARIFNTYGPRMHNNDGRVVSNFILQALRNEPLTIYGSGEQTRSFQYVSDLVEGLVALMESNHTGPVNLGNPDEHSITEFAELIQRTMGSTGGIHHLDAKEDDPQRRRPSISLAKELLGWKPSVPLEEGIRKTVEFFHGELQRKHHDQRNIYDPLIDWSHIGEDCTEGDEEACLEA